ncbi:MAG: tetratricopeptide repeat protein [Alphaproteobacteria bacterium]
MPLSTPAARKTPKLKQKLASETAIMPVTVSLTERLRNAIAFLRLGDTVEPEAIYRDILESMPRNPDALHGLGLIVLQRGEVEEAVVLLERAVSTGRVPGQFHVNFAVALETDGQMAKALKALKAGVSQHNKDAFLYQALGVFLQNRSREKEAMRALDKAARLDPDLPRLDLMRGDIHLKHEREDKALECYQRHLKQVPGERTVINRTAYLLGKRRRHQEVLDMLMPLYEDGSANADTCNNIGAALVTLGRLAEAEPFILEAQELDPGRWEFNANVAGLHMANERLDAAIELFEKLKEEAPENAQTATDLALAYMRRGRMEDAKKEIDAVTEAHPDHDAAWLALGIWHSTSVNYTLAIKAYRKAVEANPLNVHANSNLALALKTTAELDDASFYAHKVINLPDYVPMLFANAFQVFHAVCDYEGVHELGDLRALVKDVPDANLPGCVFDLMVRAGDNESSQWVASINRRWGEALEESAARNPLPPMPERAKHDKVRVGFLSSDLRDHSVGKHIMPLMEHHDHDRVEFYGYSAWDVDYDPVHHKLAGLMSGGMKTVANLPAREIAEIIRGDEIDVLFELNGHTLGSRVDVIPYRAAPVQVEWLGFPFTTGLKDLDYFLLDKFVAPTKRSLMIEKPLMMPESWTIFSGFADMPITETLPVEVNGYITFGSLNAPYKLTQRTIEAWSRVLMAVPNSRLMLVRVDYESRVLCANIAHEFNKHGVNSERLGFFNNKAKKIHHLDCYNFIDMSLDTFPVTGGTTTCDAMWMGVPVVTLVGDSYHQRISYALLSHVGLDELCTHTPEAFVEAAVNLANDIDSLKFLRQNLRNVLQESYLCDGPRYAKNFCDVMENLAREHGLA